MERRRRLIYALGNGPLSIKGLDIQHREGLRLVFTSFSDVKGILNDASI